MQKDLILAILLTAIGSSALGKDAEPHPLTPVPIQQVILDDEFWSPKVKV